MVCLRCRVVFGSLGWSFQSFQSFSVFFLSFSPGGGLFCLEEASTLSRRRLIFMVILRVMVRVRVRVGVRVGVGVGVVVRVMRHHGARR